MKKKAYMRILSLMLAAAVAGSMTPASVLAGEDDTAAVEESQEEVSGDDLAAAEEEDASAEDDSAETEESSDAAATDETAETDEAAEDQTGDITYTASAGGQAISGVLKDSGSTYSYTDYYGAVTVVPLETLLIPAGTQTVDIQFSGNVLAYNYDADSTYLAGYYEDYMTGADTASVSVDANSDGIMDYILVQTPYDSNWSSTLLYVITFSYENGADSQPEEAEEEIQDMYLATGNAQLASLTSDPASENQDASVADWQVLGLSRAGVEIPQETLDAYYQSIKEKLTENDGVLSSTKYTEYSRTILALTAAGYDPTDVAGYDLTEKLADYDAVSRQGLNGHIYALIALDCGDYEIPDAGEGKTQTTREKLVGNLLDAQLEDKGWALSGASADPDVTALAIQALAPYYDTDATVKAAVDAAVEKLSDMQNEDGSFTTSLGEKASETSAQVITALCAIGIDPAEDARFVKNGTSAVDALSLFYVNGEGFAHTENGACNVIATNQCYYALVAYHRFLNGQNSLYDMKDAAKASPADDSKADSTGDSKNNSGKQNSGSTQKASAASTGKSTSSASQTAGNVKTGDNNGILIWLILLLAAGAVSGAVYRRKRA